MHVSLHFCSLLNLFGFERISIGINTILLNILQSKIEMDVYHKMSLTIIVCLSPPVVLSSTLHSLCVKLQSYES